MRSCRLLALGLVPPPAFAAILGVEGKLQLQGRNILLCSALGKL